MNTAVRILAALSAAVSTIVAVYQASPGGGMPQEVLIALVAISAALAASVAVLKAPAE